MKAFTLLLVLISLSSYAQNYKANHCEIFVDKVTTMTGNHNSAQVNFFLKVLDFRLDAPVQEVGFRYLETVQHFVGGTLVQAWRQRTATQHDKRPGYYYLSLGTSNDFGSSSYTGSFYVKTKKGTYYWHKPNDVQDYSINQGTFEWIASKQNGPANSYDPKYAAPTQGSDLSYFNPASCY